jgi:hypothetical protein
VDVPARLVTAGSLPSASRLLEFLNGRHRTPAGQLAAVMVEDCMRVYHLERLLAGGSGPVAEFPAPWADASRDTGHTFLPDLSAAVFGQSDRVRAVGPDGATRWEWVHSQDPCGASRYGGGSVAVTSAGTQVWAVAPGTGERGMEGSDLAVLAADDGRLLGRAPVLEWQPRPYPVVHPDGRHVGMNFVDQDYSSMFWAVLDADGAVRAWQADGEEECVVDVRADGKLVASYHADRHLVALRRFPDGCLCTQTDIWEMREILDRVPQDNEDDPDYRWCEAGGFVNGQTVLATLTSPDYATWTHWLLDTPPDPDDGQWTGLAPRRVKYQGAPDHAGPSMHRARAIGMGDGTWLTAAGDSFQQWTLA